MIEATCPHCQETVEIKSSQLGSRTQCAACGKTFILKRSKKSASIGGNLIFVGVLLLLVVPVVGAFLWYRSVAGDPEAELAEREKAAEERVTKWRAENPEAAKLADEAEKDFKKSSSGDQIGAWSAIQRAVEQRLDAPSTAEFPFGGHRAVKHLGGGRYGVSSHVEAKNTFGAMVKTPFTAVVVDTGNGWSVESVVFN